jgi:hypothetical protein
VDTISQSPTPTLDTISGALFGGSLVGAALVVARTASSGARGQRVKRQFFGQQAQPEPVAAKPVFEPSAQLGAVAPLGYFDPLGYCQPGDEAEFNRLRSSEIKHGRLAMMASVGAVAQHFLNPKVHGTFGAMNSEIGVFGMMIVLVFSSFLEASVKEASPGNYGDPLGFNQYNSDMRTKELNNGRMAMISILGIFVAEIATGKDAIEQFAF